MFPTETVRKVITLLLVALILVIGLGFSDNNGLAKSLGEYFENQASGIYNQNINYDDDYFDPRELGVEWINNYPGIWVDTSYNDDSCLGLYQWFNNKGWLSYSADIFHFGNTDVWEIDAKREDKGGHEDSYIDSVDLAMICAHGVRTWDNELQANQGALFYAVSHDDRFLTPSDGFNSYGGDKSDSDLEWMAFDASGVLSDDSKGSWAASMNGLHLLLGFKNFMYRHPFGDGLFWASNMTGQINFPAQRIAQAWMNAVDIVQPGGTCARILGEGSLSFYDVLPGNGHNYSVPIDDKYSEFTHCSTNPNSNLLFINQLQPEVTTMPVLQVQNRTVNEDYVRDRIAPGFNLTGPISMDEQFYYMSATTGAITRTLRVDQETGGFSYLDLTKVWVPQVVTPTLPSLGMAGLYVDQWLNGPAENLPGAWYRNAGSEYTQEDINGQFKSGAGIGEQNPQAITSTPVDVSMAYPRNITVNAGTASGEQAVTFPIVGPGGRFKVYLGDLGAIIGAIGGSRDVQETGEQVTVLSQEAVWNMFLADNRLALTDLTVASDTVSYTVAALGYYEMPYPIHQSELIPVWIFTTDFYFEGNLVAENVPVYLPAASGYIHPVVSIQSPVDGETYCAGQPIYFAGSATGGTPPYTATWSGSQDGQFGDIFNLTHPLGSFFRGEGPSTQIVTLQVTDANGVTGGASITLNINPIFWLPLITR